jgi:hypothetical protein
MPEARQHAIIVLASGDFEQLACVADLAIEPRQHRHYGFEGFTLPAQLLSAFVVAPNGRIFDELGDLGEAFLLRVEVKDTSAALSCGSQRPAAAWRWH